MSSDERVTCNVTEAIESHAQGEQNSKAAEIEKVSDSGGELVCVRVFVCVYARVCACVCMGMCGCDCLCVIACVSFCVSV